MPSGKVHQDLWATGWIVESVAGFVLLLYYPAIAIGSVVGYFLGQYITPDADIPNMTHSEWKLLRIPILGALIVAYYTFYGGLFSRKHRSFWTHSLVFSTAIRFVYSFWWIYFLNYWQTWFLQGLLGVFVGLCLADAIHIMADRILGGR